LNGGDDRRGNQSQRALRRVRLSLRIDRGVSSIPEGPSKSRLDILALRRADDVEKMYNVKVAWHFRDLKHPM